MNATTQRRTGVKTFEFCIVSKEYRTVTVSAKDEEEGRAKVWDMMDTMLKVKAEDCETDVYLEGEPKLQKEELT